VQSKLAVKALNILQDQFYPNRRVAKRPARRAKRSDSRRTRAFSAWRARAATKFSSWLPRSSSATTTTAEKKAEPRYPSLPHARVRGIQGLLELVQERGDAGGLAELASDLRLEMGDLMII
jgi:hypothetical protein